MVAVAQRVGAAGVWLPGGVEPRGPVYGEIVDLYWRRSEVNLALELETCWNELRARTPFPLLCSYEVAPGENAAPICACHETVLAA